MIDNGMPVVWGVLLVLGLGLLIGSAHGFVISVIKIPPFIATLAGMLVFRGVCQVILSGQTKGPYPVAFQHMSTGYISYYAFNRDIVSLILGAIIIVLLIFTEFSDRKSKKKYGLEVLPIYLSIAKLAIISLFVGFLAYMLSNYNGVPIILCIVVGLAVFYTFVMQNTIIGRHIYTVGGNQISAKLSGINVGKIKFIVFANMGMLAALAGMIVAGRLNAATPRAGDGYELDAIAACYIGGASTSGGIGTIVGGIVGAMVMGVLNNGMSIMGLPIDWQRIIKGLVLIVAVSFDLYAKKRSANA
jgi:putative multiple sugar transport system permease protein